MDIIFYIIMVNSITYSVNICLPSIFPLSGSDCFMSFDAVNRAFLPQGLTDLYGESTAYKERINNYFITQKGYPLPL